MPEEQNPFKDLRPDQLDSATTQIRAALSDKRLTPAERADFGKFYKQIAETRGQRAERAIKQMQPKGIAHPWSKDIQEAGGILGGPPRAVRGVYELGKHVAKTALIEGKPSKLLAEEEAGRQATWKRGMESLRNMTKPGLRPGERLFELGRGTQYTAGATIPLAGPYAINTIWDRADKGDPWGGLTEFLTGWYLMERGGQLVGKATPKVIEAGADVAGTLARREAKRVVGGKEGHVDPATGLKEAHPPIKTAKNLSEAVEVIRSKQHRDNMAGIDRATTAGVRVNFEAAIKMTFDEARKRASGTGATADYINALNDLEFKLSRRQGVDRHGNVVPGQPYDLANLTPQEAYKIKQDIDHLGYGDLKGAASDARPMLQKLNHDLSLLLSNRLGRYLPPGGFRLEADMIGARDAAKKRAEDMDGKIKTGLQSIWHAPVSAAVVGYAVADMVGRLGIKYPWHYMAAATAATAMHWVSSVTPSALAKMKLYTMMEEILRGHRVPASAKYFPPGGPPPPPPPGGGPPTPRPAPAAPPAAPQGAPQALASPLPQAAPPAAAAPASAPAPQAPPPSPLPSGTSAMPPGTSIPFAPGESVVERPIDEFARARRDKEARLQERRAAFRTSFEQPTDVTVTTAEEMKQKRLAAKAEAEKAKAAKATAKKESKATFVGANVLTAALEKSIREEHPGITDAEVQQRLAELKGEAPTSKTIEGVPVKVYPAGASGLTETGQKLMGEFDVLQEQRKANKISQATYEERLLKLRDLVAQESSNLTPEQRADLAKQFRARLRKRDQRARDAAKAPAEKTEMAVEGSDEEGRIQTGPVEKRLNPEELVSRHQELMKEVLAFYKSDPETVASLQAQIKTMDPVQALALLEQVVESIKELEADKQ